MGDRAALTKLENELHLIIPYIGLLMVIILDVSSNIFLWLLHACAVMFLDVCITRYGITISLLSEHFLDENGCRKTSSLVAWKLPSPTCFHVG